ncbi:MULTISPECIES: TIR domain-containing protein [unclassified Streptomyces]|uniref:TIR domain-containing protein n=1 Tax=unclassified Streptomyces TaxID=2593676 RepID=UPI0036ED6470
MLESSALIPKWAWCGQLSRPKVFISFQMRDAWAREVLLEGVRGIPGGLEIVDHSIRYPLDANWKDACRPRIADTHGTVVLVGATTFASAPVQWEIRQTLLHGHELIGIQVRDGEIYRIPENLSRRNVMRWDFVRLSSLISAWV